MAVVVYLVLFLTMTGHSSALYCLCKDGVSESALQKAIDYACGAGANCSPIIQNGACYQPNTVKDHCNYAVNSYFQNKAQNPQACEFAGAASTSPSPPSTVATGCVFPSSASTGGTGTTTPTTGNPTTGTGTTTPSTGTGTTTPTTGTTTATPTVFGGSGLGPSGTTGINDSSTMALFKRSNMFSSFALSLLVSCLVLVWA